MSFGVRLRQARTEKNLTQAELAKMLSLGESTISFYEANKREPDYETLQKLADLLDVSLDWLLGRSNVKTPIEIQAAHRTDDPMDELPPEARKSLEEFKAYILQKYRSKDQNNPT